MVSLPAPLSSLHRLVFCMRHPVSSRHPKRFSVPQSLCSELLSQAPHSSLVSALCTLVTWASVLDPLATKPGPQSPQSMMNSTLLYPDWGQPIGKQKNKQTPNSILLRPQLLYFPHCLHCHYLHHLHGTAQGWTQGEQRRKHNRGIPSLQEPEEQSPPQAQLEAIS